VDGFAADGAVSACFVFLPLRLAYCGCASLHFQPIIPALCLLFSANVFFAGPLLNEAPAGFQKHWEKRPEWGPRYRRLPCFYLAGPSPVALWSLLISPLLSARSCTATGTKARRPPTAPCTRRPPEMDHAVSHPDERLCPQERDARERPHVHG